MFLLVSVLLCASANGHNLNHAHLEPRILNGIPVNGHGSLPFVSLQDSDGHFCAGTIICKNWVLTAARCVAKQNISEIWIKAGIEFVNQPGDVHTIKRTIVHEKFDYSLPLGFATNDIALIEVVHPFQIEPMDFRGIHKGAKDLLTLGWGFEEDGNLRGMVLEDPIHSQENICEESSSFGISTGDFGGPLVNIYKQLVGIASFVIPTEGSLISCFERIDQHEDWIMSKVTPN